MTKKTLKKFTQKFRKKSFTVRFRKVRIDKPAKKHLRKQNQYYWGMTYYEDRRIYIDPKATKDERLLLETALDEAIHACQWDLDNDAVDEIATDIADFLLRIGFRFQR